MAGQLVERGKNTWLIRIYLGRVEGKRKYYNETFHGTEKEAERRKRKLLTKADEGLLLAGGGEVDTVEGYANAWLEQAEARGLRERTIQTYEGVLKTRILPHLGDTCIRDLDVAALKRWIAKLGKEDLSPRTVRLGHEVLRNMLESAVEDEVIPTNPARARAVSKALPRMEKKERVTIPADKVTDFLEAAVGCRLEALWHVLLLGGLRPEEALALAWKDVKLPKIRVRRVLVDTSEEWPKYMPPKSKRSRRVVTLPATAAKALERHRRRQVEERLKVGDAWYDPDLVFTDEAGWPLRQHKLRAPFKAILKNAELPKMRIYDLRHSCATLLLEAGEELETVKQRLGHSSIVLTSDTYGGVSEGIQRNAADTLDEIAAGKGG